MLLVFKGWNEFLTLSFKNSFSFSSYYQLFKTLR